MKLTSQTRKSGGRRGREEVAGVEPFDDGDAGVVAQGMVKLAVADVDGGDMRRTALQQDLRKAAGRGADVERFAALRIEAEMVRPAMSFKAARET